MFNGSPHLTHAKSLNLSTRIKIKSISKIVSPPNKLGKLKISTKKMLNYSEKESLLFMHSDTI